MGACTCSVHSGIAGGSVPSFTAFLNFPRWMYYYKPLELSLSPKICTEHNCQNFDKYTLFTLINLCNQPNYLLEENSQYIICNITSATKQLT